MSLKQFSHDYKRTSRPLLSDSTVQLVRAMEGYRKMAQSPELVRAMEGYRKMAQSPELVRAMEGFRKMAQSPELVRAMEGFRKVAQSPELVRAMEGFRSQLRVSQKTLNPDYVRNLSDLSTRLLSSAPPVTWDQVRESRDHLHLVLDEDEEVLVQTEAIVREIEEPLEDQDARYSQYSATKVIYALLMLIAVQDQLLQNLWTDAEFARNVLEAFWAYTLDLLVWFRDLADH